MSERVISYGHPNVTGKHRTTVEVTKEPSISIRADCIIGVNSDKGMKELSEEFKTLAKNKETIIEVTIRAGEFDDTIRGRGHPDLTFTHETDIVTRKSDFICNRTLMINADKACIDLNHELVKKLKNPDQKLEFIIKAITTSASVAQTGQSD